MKIFNAICFCIIMDHHKSGVEEAHPDYIEEKLNMFERSSEYEAFNMLDAPNQQRAIRWCRNWDIKLPVQPESPFLD